MNDEIRYTPAAQSVDVFETPAHEHPRGQTVTVRISTKNFGQVFVMTPSEAASLRDALDIHLIEGATK